MLSLGLCQAVRHVLVDYLFHHLVEAIGHALAILLSYLLRSEIGRNECEELLVVSLHEQVYNRVEHIAVVQNFERFGAKVIYAQHRVARQVVPGFEVYLAKVSYLTSRDDANAPVLFAQLITQVQSVEQRLECLYKCRLAIAAGAAKQDAELAAAAGEEVGHLRQLVFQLIGNDKLALSEFDLSFHCHRQSGDSIFF